MGAALLELKAKHNIKREDIFLQTKYTPIGGQDASKPLPYNPSDPISTQILTSHQTSLSNLHTTYIDSYLLHSPLPTIEQTLEAWHTLMKLQDEGKVRMIGVSNTYDVRILAALQKARKVQVVQNRWYEGNGWDHAVLNYCREHDIMYQCVTFHILIRLISVLMNMDRSFWTLTGSPSLLSHPSLIRIASASNMTPAQVVYKLSQEADVTPLSGTTNQQHMIEDVAVENSTFAEGMETRLKEVKSFVFDNAGIDSTV